MDPTRSRPVAIAVAPNGARRTRRDHAELPLGPGETARSAGQALEAGAAILHLHVRDPQGGHVLDAELYREATQAVRSAVGDRLVVQVTTEAVGRYSPAEQRAVIDALRPEAVSVALRELAAPGEEAAFFAFLARCRRHGTAVQVILYDRADRDRLLAFAQAGDVDPASVAVLYVLGRYAEAQVAHPGELLAFLDEGRSPWPEWMACAFGPHETRCLALAALLGGDVRTGFENNFAMPDGRLAANNAELVDAAATVVTALGLPLADAGEVRRRWMP